MYRGWVITVIVLGLITPSYAAAGGKAEGRQDAMNIINSLPPDLHAKIQALARMLDQDIKSGKLTETDVQQGMMSGQLGERLRNVHPEAGQLLDDISDSMRSGKGPGEESLMPLLGGLAITPR
jgi:hypothetical protein